MSVGRLITFFSSFTKLPVYAEDVRDQIVDLGIQDHIEFHPIDVDPNKLLGLYVRFRRRNGVYAEHQNCSVIFYNANVDSDEQNFICIKELMHVFDEHLHAAVTTAAGLDAHLSYLFKNVSEAPIEAKLSGIVDRAAEWAAMAVMFPEDVRQDFMSALAEERLDYAEFAAALGIPQVYVSELVSDRWESFRKMLLAL